VVAAQHERDEPGAPPRGDLFPRGVELLAGGAPSGSSQSPMSAIARSSRSRASAGE